MKFVSLTLLFLSFNLFAARPAFKSGDIVDLRQFEVEFHSHQTPGPLGLIIKGKATMYLKHQGKIIAKYRYEYDDETDYQLFKLAMNSWKGQRNRPGMGNYVRIKIPAGVTTTGYGEFAIQSAVDPAKVDPNQLNYFEYQKFAEDVSLAEIIHSTLPDESKQVHYRGVPVGFRYPQSWNEGNEYDSTGDYMDLDENFDPI